MLAVLLMVGAMSVLCTSCGDDEEEAPGGLLQSSVHTWEDLGLPSGTLWATCNIGADSPEQSGLYFAWGETTGYSLEDEHEFSWENYQHCVWDMDRANPSWDYMWFTKYCSDSEYGDDGYTDDLTELTDEDDAAIQLWGEEWRMPTRSQLEELIDEDYTTFERTTMNGVAGLLVKSKQPGNDASIFLPAAGYLDIFGDVYDEDIVKIWTSTLSETEPFKALGLASENNEYYIRYIESGDRDYGMPIRPVRAQ